MLDTNAVKHFTGQKLYTKLNNKFLQLLIFGILLFGIAEPQTSNVNQEYYPSPADSAVTKPLITLERTQCYGTCPGYELKIYENRLIIYRGKSFVKIKGEVKDTLSQTQLDRLINLFRDANYFTLKHRYQEQSSCALRATDHSSVITSFRDGGKYEKIDHYLGCYQSIDENGNLTRSKADVQLIAIEDSLDCIVGTDRWIR